MMNGPIATDKEHRQKWRQLHFLVTVHRSRVREGKLLVLDPKMTQTIHELALHEAIVHAFPFHGLTQLEEFTIRYNAVVDYFAPSDTTITNSGLPLRRA